MHVERWVRTVMLLKCETFDGVHVVAVEKYCMSIHTAFATPLPEMFSYSTFLMYLQHIRI